MKFENNNKEIIKRITNRSLKSNKTRNIFVVIAIVLTTFMLACVFTLGISFNENYQLTNESKLYLPHGQNLISLNHASLDDLMTLKGIGEKTAIKIDEYRQKTPFQTIEDLMNIQGIGEKTYLRLREYLCL